MSEKKRRVPKIPTPTIEELKIMTQDALDDALIVASTKNNLPLVKELLTSEDLKCKANINIKNSTKYSALMNACYNDSLEVVKYLLTSPDLREHADLYKSVKGMDAFMLSCSNLSESKEVTKFLLFDMNIEISSHHMAFLNGWGGIEEKYSDVLKLIDMRDLKNKLNNNLINKDKDIIIKKI